MPRICVALATSADDRALAMGVWRAANAARRRPAGELRTERVRQKIEAAELLLVAHYGSRPAGMLLAETYVDGGVRRPLLGHLSMVFVDPAVWDSRVGTALIRDVQQRDWDSLSVWTRTDNRRARRLYVSTGFTDTGARAALQDGDEIMQFRWGR